MLRPSSLVRQAWKSEGIPTPSTVFEQPIDSRRLFKLNVLHANYRGKDAYVSDKALPSYQIVAIWASQIALHGVFLVRNLRAVPLHLNKSNSGMEASQKYGPTL